MQNLAVKSSTDHPDLVNEIWSKIAPYWPLQNIIACNPLRGFEDLKFDKALAQGYDFFKHQELPAELNKINQITIKWCQVYFDRGQATLKMPNRHKNFYQSWRELAIYDKDLTENLSANIEFLNKLPDNSNQAIWQILEQFNFNSAKQNNFLTLSLTTLAGWSAFVKYLGEWSYQKDGNIQNDFLAIRLAIIWIIWGKSAEKLLDLDSSNNKKLTQQHLQIIEKNEQKYRQELFNLINNNHSRKNSSAPQKNYDAQFVFCIDVRSEPMRKKLEQVGNYETFGFAGFFGIPTAIASELTEESYASCPVLLTPKHQVLEKTTCQHHKPQKLFKGYATLQEIKKFYQSLKYNFTTPLPLAEGIGIWSGGWMLVKTFSPKGRKLIHNKIKSTFKQHHHTSPEISSIPFEDQVNYALGFLKSVGLTQKFAPVILLCGHGSQTENNSFATSLDCGACGGRHGDSNAKILAKILNQESIREALRQSAIDIPSSTKFIASKHNTTNDNIEIYDAEILPAKILNELQDNLAKARELNQLDRASQMTGEKTSKLTSHQLQKFFFNKTQSWSETRPEWALARNASFIVAPRAITKNLNLEGRAFLHSYDWQIDKDNSILNLILNAPMVVAQWINSQYLFSTLDNITFGAGNKITHNVVGKIGVMQGNASDLMNGLPMQSVFINDQKNYHQPLRLSTLIYAPKHKIHQVVTNSDKVQQLIKNEWIKLFCLEVEDDKIYEMTSDLKWRGVL